MPRGNEGFDSTDFGSTWIQGHHPDKLSLEYADLREEAGDMFLGWIYGQLPGLRGSWMSFWMPNFLTSPTPPDLTQSP